MLGLCTRTAVMEKSHLAEQQDWRMETEQNRREEWHRTAQK